MNLFVMCMFAGDVIVVLFLVHAVSAARQAWYSVTSSYRYQLTLPHRTSMVLGNMLVISVLM